MNWIISYSYILDYLHQYTNILLFLPTTKSTYIDSTSLARPCPISILDTEIIIEKEVNYYGLKFISYNALSSFTPTRL